jgi:hypothetical protein
VYYSYKKDERAKPGNLLTTWYFFTSPHVMSPTLLFLLPHSVLSPTGRVVTQAVNEHPLTSKTRVRYQVSSCEICEGQSGTGTVLSPSTSVFNPPVFMSSTCCCYQNHKWVKSGNLPNSKAVFEIGQHRTEKCFYLEFKCFHLVSRNAPFYVSVSQHEELHLYFCAQEVRLICMNT